jgi:hypothetical protein
VSDASFRPSPRRHNKFGVVPANAGTHNHRPLLLRKVSTHTTQIEKPRRMGPRLRGDDREMVLRKGGK